MIISLSTGHLAVLNGGAPGTNGNTCANVCVSNLDISPCTSIVVIRKIVNGSCFLPEIMLPVVRLPDAILNAAGARTK